MWGAHARRGFLVTKHGLLDFKSSGDAGAHACRFVLSPTNRLLDSKSSGGGTCLRGLFVAKVGLLDFESSGVRGHMPAGSFVATKWTSEF